MEVKKIWEVVMIEGHLKGVTRTPQRKIFVIKDPHTNPSLVIMKSIEFFNRANGDLFIGRELPDKATLIELIREHQS